MDDLQTLVSITERLRLWGESDALVSFHDDQPKRLSYRELADSVDSLATGFQKLGICKGKFVVVLSPNSPEWIIACLAAIKCGAIAVPLDVQSDEQTVAAIFNDLRPSAVCTTTARAQALTPNLHETGTRTILLDTQDDQDSWKHICSSDKCNVAVPAENDIAALFYTSGTTGAPKGVPLSHGNIMFEIQALSQIHLVGPDDRVLLPLPLHHIYPFAIGMFFPLALGLPIILPESLTGTKLSSALRAGQVTAIIGVPRLYRAFYDGIQSRVKSAGRFRSNLFHAMLSFSNFLRSMGISAGKTLFKRLHAKLGCDLRILASGGAALDADLAAKLEALGFEIAIGYGLTETSPLLTLRQPRCGKPDNVGRPLPRVEIRIESGNSTTDDQGEILARGPGVFHGYRNLPEKTTEALPDGEWFRTGDLGYFKDGNLHVVGRIASLIVTESGEKIDPEQLEAHYQQSQMIREIGILQQSGKLVAVVVPNFEQFEAAGGGDLNRIVHDAIDDGALPLPTYKRLSGFVICREPLPKTAMGKLRRHELSETYKALASGKRLAARQLPIASDEDHLLLSDPATQTVWQLLISRYGSNHVWLDASLQLDLGIDSLEWLAVTMEIDEAVGVNLDQEHIGQMSRVRDLLAEVLRQSRRPAAVLPPADPITNPEKVLSTDEQKWLQPLDYAHSIMQACLYSINCMLMHLLFRLKVVGLENIPKDVQVVFTPNHASFADPFVLAAALPLDVLRKTHWAAWTGIAFGNQVNSFISRLAQSVPIDTDHSLVSSLAFGAAVLKARRNLIWFPEGRRTLTGEVQQFKAGLGLLLDRMPVAVIPVFLSGTGDALPPGKRMIRLAKITVYFGAPEYPANLVHEGTGDQPYERMVNALRDKVQGLDPAIQFMNPARSEAKRPQVKS